MDGEVEDNSGRTTRGVVLMNLKVKCSKDGVKGVGRR